MIICAGCDEAAIVPGYIGQPLPLYCTNPCSNYTWFKDDVRLKSGSSSSFLLTNSVSIADEGGQMYSCVCEENNIKECFIVWGM